MFVKLVFGLVACAALAGCSAKMVRVTYNSVPEGAAIIQNGQLMGHTPVALLYRPTASFKAGQCMEAPAITAQWASGAMTSINPTMCANIGRNQSFLFQRPNVAGAEIDAQVETAQAYAQAAAQAQVDAQQEAMLYQAAGSLGNAVGCAAAGGCVPPPPVVNYPAAPAPTYRSTVQPFSDPPVTCRLDPTGTSATCH